MNHDKKIINLITTLAHRHSSWEVFTDFIEMAAISFSNSVDYFNRAKREAQYMDIVKKYEKRDLDRFPEMLAELTLAMEVTPGDILGRIYGELELSNKWAGQYFTPDAVSRMMAKMLLTDDMRRLINEKGFITVQEPALGGGAMIINLALAMKEEGINYQQSMLVTGIDIDIKSIHMAYVQLSLMHIPAILIHGNSLSLEVYSKWFTPAYIIGGWSFKRQKEKQAQVVELPMPQQNVVAKKSKYELISLFG